MRDVCVSKSTFEKRLVHSFPVAGRLITASNKSAKYVINHHVNISSFNASQVRQASRPVGTAHHTTPHHTPSPPTTGLARGSKLWRGFNTLLLQFLPYVPTLPDNFIGSTCTGTSDKRQILRASTARISSPSTAVRVAWPARKGQPGGHPGGQPALAGGASPAHLVLRHVQLLAAAVGAKDSTTIPAVGASAPSDVKKKVSIEAVRAERAHHHLFVLDPSLARSARESSGGHGVA